MAERVLLVDMIAPNLPSEPFSWRRFFERVHSDRAPIKALGKPCHDCAVTCGFYREYTDELAKLPAEFQDHIAERWYCHNHPNRACRGNIDALTLARSEPLPLQRVE